MIKKNALPNVPTVLTPYLQTVRLPLIPQNPVAEGEPAGNVLNPELNVHVNPEPIGTPIVEPPSGLLTGS